MIIYILVNLRHLDISKTMSLNNQKYIFKQLEKLTENNKCLRILDLSTNNITYCKETSKILVKFLNMNTLSTLNISNNSLGFKFINDIFDIDLNNFIFNRKIENRTVDINMNDNFKLEGIRSLTESEDLIIRILKFKFTNFINNLE